MKGLDRLVDMSRYRPHLDIQPEPHPRAEHGRLDAQPDSGEERSSRRTCLGEQLDGGTDADGPLDANRRRFTELDLEVVIVRQRRSDDLFLHLTVERDVQFLAYVVLSQVDQRVLLGELGERDVQRALVGGAKWWRSGVVRGSPIASPIRTSPRPQSLPIRPAATDARWTDEPRSNTHTP